MNLTPGQLKAQYERARERWPFFHDIEAAHSLPRFLLFAVGSRETNLRPEFTEGATGDGGHGHGLFQLDDRWHDIPDGFDTDPALQAETAAFKLHVDQGRFWDWVKTLNYYNSGSPNTEDTTGGDYGPDVWSRRQWLADNYGEERPMKFVTRSEWGARAPRGRTALSVNVATAHWGGDSPGALEHDECAAWLRSWQAMHMDTHGWTDLAYNLAVCQHGYVFEGRGKGARSAANGTNEGNGSSYAIVYIGGTPAPFTAEAKAAFNQAADYLGASLDWGHRDWLNTACPGDEIYEWVHAGHPADGTTQEDEMNEEQINTLKWCQDVLARVVANLHPENDAYGGAEEVNRVVRETRDHLASAHNGGGGGGVTLEEVRGDLRARLQ